MRKAIHRYRHPLLLLAFLAWATPGWACSCDFAPPPEQFARSAAVFTGSVTGIDGVTPGPFDRIRLRLGLMPMPRGNRFTFTLKSSWKGVTTRTVDVTIFGVEGCGSRFDVGQEFLVYAYGESSDFVTGMCSRTAPISAAAADLRYLSTLTTLPLPGATGWQSYVGLFAWIGGAALALASLELWRRRRPG